VGNSHDKAGTPEFFLFQGIAHFIERLCKRGNLVAAFDINIEIQLSIGYAPGGVFQNLNRAGNGLSHYYGHTDHK
jgi:hypothetical protein